MIFLGYNFLQDRYSWQPVPTDLTNINNITIKNGIYDHFNITKDTTFPYITTIPGDWDLSTQLDADFDGNLNAGNIDYVISQISSIRVKRRIKGTFDWYTLDEIPINTIEDVDFVRYDYIAQNGIEYEYAIVPVIGNIEGEYSINSIMSEFYGVFITDNSSIYKFKPNVSYSATERTNQTAIYEPYGSKYPIIISNGLLSYDKGNVTGDILVLDNRENLDRMETVERLNAIKEFLGTTHAKVLKDFNGNIWLVAINDNIPLTYYSEVGMGFAAVSFNWTEIGDANSGQDLYDNDLIYSNS